MGCQGRRLAISAPTGAGKRYVTWKTANPKPYGTAPAGRLKASQVSTMTSTPINPSTAHGRLARREAWSVTCLAQVDQYGFDSAMDICLFAQSKLREDCVDVLLDHPHREMKPFGNRVVVAALGHLREHVALTL